MKLGERLKELRENQGLLQRQLSAQLEIDTPMFSKIERGERRAKREQVVLLASILKANENELLTIWLVDQILAVIDKEKVGVQALKFALREIEQQ
ncbi:helix-turn-helix domain-containing protein [Formosa maritima]|uniref:Helix-turn-helix transcriptional regulator n=1 Tax=Formosa maritima TaxID=2592046 RepID=A0A5D0GEL5_9FLAO|nr:helix-turn-helix transcriptional regulator [Formosa maritima]TYA57356.1 helix-turn-helix transcriptional regulator [Formosa maritima]